MFLKLFFALCTISQSFLNIFSSLFFQIKIIANKQLYYITMDLTSCIFQFFKHKSFVTLSNFHNFNQNWKVCWTNCSIFLFMFSNPRWLDCSLFNREDHFISILWGYNMAFLWAFNFPLNYYIQMRTLVHFLALFCYSNNQQMFALFRKLAAAHQPRLELQPSW